MIKIISKLISLRFLGVEGPLSGQRQFLTIESPLKFMKNAFYFMLKALFVLEIFTFLSWSFGYVEKHLDEKVMVNFEIYDVTNWITNNHNTNSSNISGSKGNQAIKFGQLINYSVRNIFLQKSCRKWDRETSFRPLFVSLKGFIWGKTK